MKLFGSGTSPRRRALMVIALAGASVVTFFSFIYLGGVYVQIIHAPINENSLTRSVANEAGSAYFRSPDNSCEISVGFINNWDCEIVDRQGTGFYLYAVTVKTGTSCWRARLLAHGRDHMGREPVSENRAAWLDAFGEKPGRAAMSGCVNRFEGGWPSLILG